MPQPETLQRPQTTQRPVHLLSDIGNAVRFVSDHGEKVRFVGDWGCWTVYDGKRWRSSPGAESVLELAKATVKAMLADAVADYKVASDRLAEAVGEEEEAKAKIAQKAALSAIMHAKKSHGVKQLRDMLFAARSDPKVFIPVGGDVFDIRHDLLNVPNGTVDLRTGKLRPHDWRDYQTALCPTRYNPNATAPTWDRFLRDIFPGAPDVADYVRDLVGYMLTGDTTDQALYLLVGGGANGKSVLLELLLLILGDDFTYVTPVEVLMDASGNRHPTEKAGFRGARLAISSETQEEGALNESRIKSLTGSDRITARYCNRDFFSFPPTHKLFIATNHRPRIRGTDNGTWRRVRLIEFPRRFWSDADKLREPGGTFDPKDKADPSLIGKL